MKIRRDIASIPVRSAKETWQAIIDLITSSDSIDVSQLLAAASNMESVIADEYPANVPIVVKGCGSRLVIYCRYDQDAMEIGKDVDSLHWNPTAGDWQMTVPCEEEDVAWLTKSLKSRAPRIIVRTPDQQLKEETAGEEAAIATSDFHIDWGVLDKQ
jgi:hypothetical protein